MSKWHVGQKVVVVEPCGGRTAIIEAEITKIGRKWITTGSGYNERRFDFAGFGERDWVHKPRIWPDRATYEAHVERRHRWDEFHSLVRQRNHPPEHLTTEQIDALIAAITKPGEGIEG